MHSHCAPYAAEALKAALKQLSGRLLLSPSPDAELQHRERLRAGTADLLAQLYSPPGWPSSWVPRTGEA